MKETKWLPKMDNTTRSKLLHREEILARKLLHQHEILALGGFLNVLREREEAVRAVEAEMSVDADKPVKIPAQIMKALFRRKANRVALRELRRASNEAYETLRAEIRAVASGVIEGIIEGD